jgi:Protein of unknown function (DUF4236)
VVSGFNFRKNWRLGPVRVTASNRGLSWGLKAGRWSWSPKTRRHSVDLPGVVNWRSGSRPRQRSATSPGHSPVWGLLGLALVVVVFLVVIP